MSTFLLLGNYSSEALKEISADRTDKCNRLIEKFGGEVKSIYALLGCYDLVMIVDFPTTDDAMKASIALTKLTNISFATYPAVSVEQFDEMAEGL